MTIQGVMITALQRHVDARGAVLPILRADEEQFKGFAEVYGSTVVPGAIKGWHWQATATRVYVVLQGTIKLVLYDDREDSASRGTLQEIVAGADNYVRVTIPPRVWSAFCCLGGHPALVCDVIDRPRDPAQFKRLDPQQGPVAYDWSFPAS